MKKLRLYLLLLSNMIFLSSCSSSISDGTIPSDNPGASPNDKTTHNNSSAPNPENTITGLEPVFSIDSGFFPEGFELSIASSEGLKVYYTTDGSLPTDQSDEFKDTDTLSVSDRSQEANIYASISGTTTGTFYAPTIPIDKATILRAVTYDGEDKVSKVITKTYFVGFEDKADYYNDVAVISLVTDPDNLFDYDSGIYVTGAVYDNWLRSKEYNPTVRYWHQPANYKNSGAEWEKDAHIDFFDMNGELAFSQEVGIRMRGGASRAFLQKSFNIYARAEYGDKKIKYELFPDLASESEGSSIHSFKNIMLRNGGNDTELTKIREVLIHQLSSGLNFSVQASRPAIVFINGEFWGLYNLQEKYSEEYIESHYGVDKDNVVIVKKDKIDEGYEEDILLYHTMVDYAATNDMSDPVKYDKFCTMMDIESFIDYISVEIYVGNKDWGNNNVMLWRSRTTDNSVGNPYSDGRWRWMLYDSEYSLGLSYENSLAFDANYNPSNYRDNNFHTVLTPNSILGLLFTSLIKNDTFRTQFKTTFLEIADNTLNEDTAILLLEDYADTYKPMMVDTIMRYSKLSESKASEQFDYEVNKIRDYFSKRYDYIIGKLNDEIPD